MDRLSHAEIGGPYANREDADRAIRGGGFKQSPAELVAVEGEPDSDADDSKVASKTAGFPPADTPQTPADAGPSDPNIPDHGQPFPDQQIAEGPMTTKPAQKPNDGGSSLPGVEPFDTAIDPVSSNIDKVTAVVRMQNPGLDIPTARRIARQVVAKLIEADFDPYGMMPSVRDPLADKSPAKVLKTMLPTSKDAPSSLPRMPGGGSRGDGGGPADTASGGSPSGDSGDVLHPHRIFSPGETVPGAGAAAGEAAGGAAASGEAAGAAAGLARVLPMLMV